MNTKFSLIVLVAASAVCGTSSCKTIIKKPETAPKEIAVEAYTVSESSLLTEREYIGLVEESSSVLLSFPTPGVVNHVYVREGQSVKKGQVLATVDDSALQNLYATAKATLQQAQDGYDRLSLLHESNSIPDVQFVDIQTKLEQAKASERIAARSLENAKLVAPMDGVIGIKMIEVGLNALPDQPVLSIMNTKALLVSLAIPDNEIFETKIGQKARLTVSALGGKELTGRVIEKGVKAQMLTHSYTVKIAIEGDAGGLLPGMICRAYINNIPEQDVLEVPNSAVLPLDLGTGYFVWVVDNDNTVHRRIVQIGDLTPNGIEIVEGLAMGEKVIVAGYHKVSDNIKVTITNE